MNDEERREVELTLTEAVGKLVAKEGQFVDHVIAVYTVNGEDNEDALGIISTGYIPRWLAKGMLMDALDVIREVS